VSIDRRPPLQKKINTYFITATLAMFTDRFIIVLEGATVGKTTP